MLDWLLWLFLPWVYHRREMRRYSKRWDICAATQTEAWNNLYAQVVTLREEKKSLLTQLDRDRTDLVKQLEAANDLIQEAQARLDELTNAILYSQWNLTALIVMQGGNVVVPESVLQFASDPNLRIGAEAASDGVHLSIQFAEMPVDAADTFGPVE